MENRTAYDMLAKQFPNPQSVRTEIINLQAILNLPKGTEHFLSDLHGEAETFFHIIKSASGVIRTKIDLAFGNSMTEEEKNRLASLVYYPESVLPIMKRQGMSDEKYAEILGRLIDIVKLASAKYTRSKVRKALPSDYSYIIDELINMPYYSIDKKEYYSHIISGIIELGDADKFICEMASLIQNLSIDHLHIVGDVFDRGNGSDKILDCLMNYHSLDIEWGNHDVLWMGAFFGNPACVCNVIRINCLYRNLQVIENYGINMRPLMTFALEQYGGDDCAAFSVSDVYGTESDFEKNIILARMAKAITVIQLKIENALIRSHSEFEMDDRILYPTDLLTDKESSLIKLLCNEFKNSTKLKTHIDFILKKGSMYLVYNGNLIMHGCVPTESDGSFSPVTVGSCKYSGCALYDRLDRLVRDASQGDPYSVDFMWYLWCGKKSPLYGRDKMCIYKKYFEGVRETENNDNYYTFVKQEDYCLKVLDEFGAKGKYSIIINGHMPVRVKIGEKAVSGNGRHITIDGGLSRAYHEKTGIGGYTLISNSQGMYLVSHEQEFSVDKAINNAYDLKSTTNTVKHYEKRILVKETDNGAALIEQIRLLRKMLSEYYS